MNYHGPDCQACQQIRDYQGGPPVTCSHHSVHRNDLGAYHCGHCGEAMAVRPAADLRVAPMLAEIEARFLAKIEDATSRFAEQVRAAEADDLAGLASHDR